MRKLGDFADPDCFSEPIENTIKLDLYLDSHHILKIDNKIRFTKEIFLFPICKFPYLCNNKVAAPVYA